jgi:hypothetical protein
MVLAPLSAFYISYYLIFNQRKDMLMWSGLIAVFVTNIVIAMYVVMAWNEKDDGKVKKHRVIQPKTD